MADALGLGPSGAIRGGSSPFSRTRFEQVAFGLRVQPIGSSHPLPHHDLARFGMTDNITA